MSLRELFRPRYGLYAVVTPRRWWSRSDRKAARIAAAVADYQMLDVQKVASDMMIYGFAMTDSSGRRIPPSHLRPHN